MKLLNKYKTLSPAVKASFWFLVCSVLQKGIAFIATPIYTRLLTTEEYGYYSVYQSWMSILGIFATFNLSAGVLNNILNRCKDDGEQFSALSCVYVLEAIFAVVTFAVVTVIKLIAPDLIALPLHVLLLMALQILMNAAFSVFMLKERFNYKYLKILIISVVYSLVTVAFSLLFIKYGQNKNYSLIYGIVVASVVSYAWLVIYLFIKGKKAVDLKLWKYAFLFNLPLIPHYLSMSVLASSDRIMIESFVGYESAALYSVAYSVGMILTYITNAVNASLVPWTYQRLANKNYTKFSSISNLLVVGFAVCCLFVIMLSPEAIYVLGGEAYLEAKYCLPPIVVASFFMLLYPLYANIEFYYEKRILTMIASMVGAALNVVLNWIFIPLYGYIAAAYTTLACYALMALAHYFAYKIILKKEKIGGLYNNFVILIVSLAMISVVPLSSLLFMNNIVRYIILGILFVVIVVAAINYKKLLKIFKDKETKQE